MRFPKSVKWSSNRVPPITTPYESMNAPMVMRMILVGGIQSVLISILRRVLLKERCALGRQQGHVPARRRSHHDHVGDTPREAPPVLDGEHAKDRVAQDCHAPHPKLTSDGLQVGGQDIEGEIGRVAGRPPTASEVDVDQSQVLGEVWQRQPPIRLRADRTQDQAARSTALNGWPITKANPRAAAFEKRVG